MLRTLTEVFAFSKRTVLVGVNMTLIGVSKTSSLASGLFSKFEDLIAFISSFWDCSKSVFTSSVNSFLKEAFKFSKDWSTWGKSYFLRNWDPDLFSLQWRCYWPWEGFRTDILHFLLCLSLLSFSGSLLTSWLRKMKFWRFYFKIRNEVDKQNVMKWETVIKIQKIKNFKSASNIYLFLTPRDHDWHP